MKQNGIEEIEYIESKENQSTAKYDFSFLHKEESDKIIKQAVEAGSKSNKMEEVLNIFHHDEIEEEPEYIEEEVIKTQQKLAKMQENVTVQRREDLAKPIETLKIGNKSDIMNLMTIMTGGFQGEEDNLKELQEEKARLRFLREERERRRVLLELQEKQRQEILEKRRREAWEAEQRRLEEERLRREKLAELERLRKEKEEQERLSRMKAAQRKKERELQQLREEATKPKPRPRIKDTPVDTFETEWRPAKVRKGEFKPEESETYSLEEIKKDPSILENTII